MADRAGRKPALPAEGRKPPSYRRQRRWILVGALLGAFAAAAVLFGIMIVNRVETGTWKVPDGDDFVRVVRTVQGLPPPASKTIYLARSGVELSPGVDDAPRGVSSVLASAANKPTKMPAWKGGDAKWKSVMTCVKNLFAPFDVTVTDQRPTHDDFVLVAVSGRPADIGIKSTRVGGLAPFNGQVISKPVVFAFAAQLDHNTRAVCETVGMEVAHAYGLDHGYECKDVMTYLTGCGAKKFIDKAVPCGEKKKRACEGGALTQNSYQHLLRVLGAKK